MKSNTNPDSTVAFSPEIKTAQLDLILSSDTFADAPGLRQFLGYVVNESLGGRTGHIKGFTIAHDVFQRENPTYAQDSTIAHVEADRLRRRLKDYYLKEGQRDLIHIRIPKGGYAPLFEEMAPVSEEHAANRLAAKHLRARHRRFTRTEILAFVAIMLTLFALFRVFNLPGNETLPPGNNTLLTNKTPG
jgi:hypothetical protein